MTLPARLLVESLGYDFAAFAVLWKQDITADELASDIGEHLDFDHVDLSAIDPDLVNSVMRQDISDMEILTLIASKLRDTDTTFPAFSSSDEATFRRIDIPYRRRLAMMLVLTGVDSEPEILIGIDLRDSSNIASFLRSGAAGYTGADEEQWGQEADTDDLRSRDYVRGIPCVTLENEPTAQAGGVSGATFSDSFSGEDENPYTNAAYTNGPGAFADMQVFGHQVYGTTNPSGARVLSPTFTGDHYSEITFGVGLLYGPCVRMQSTSDASCYLLFVSNTTVVELYRVADTGSIGYTVISGAITVPAMSAGSPIRLSVIGSTLEVFTDGVSRGTYTDATLSGGQPGLYDQSAFSAIGSFSASDI